MIPVVARFFGTQRDAVDQLFDQRGGTKPVMQSKNLHPRRELLRIKLNGRWREDAVADDLC